MKRAFRSAFAVLAVLILLGGAWLAYRIANPPVLDPYAALWMEAAPDTRTGLRVTFLGVSTLLFDDGETAIMTDGFFSRPDKKQVLFGKVAPDTAVIARSLEQAGVSRLAAVMVAHSHYDHAMDAPEVARRTGAVVVGSPSTAQVARGWGLSEERIRVVKDGDILRFGRFEVSFIRSRHVPSLVTGGEISEPLVPPVRAHAYREGVSYSMLIRHDGRTMLVQASAGFVEGALRGRQADVVFLGVGLLGRQSPEYRRAYWNETVAAVGARRVIPIHWDDFSFPLNQPVLPLPPPLDDFDATMAFLSRMAAEKNVDLKLVPVWSRIDPWIGLHARRDAMSLER